MLTVYTKRPPPVRLLVVADLHWAVRDRAAWAVAEAFRLAWQPAHLISLGDLVEFAPASRWVDVNEAADGTLSTPDPDELLEEVHAAGAIYARWRRDHPTAQIEAVMGNHEAHFARYLATSARAALGEANLPRRWDLANLQIRYTRYGRGQELPYGPHGLWITHGVRAGVHPAKTELALWQRPGLSGHVHRADVAGRRGIGTDWISWQSVPCLRTLDPGGTWAIHPAWNQGVTIGEYDAGRNHLHLEVVPIVDGVLTFRGNEWRADASETRTDCVPSAA